MKFICTNCRAKYQIADEKVAGRTLRMTCRQCKQEIVIRSPKRLTPAAAAPSPLASGLQQALTAGTRPVPPLPLEDAWHVGINDVPVGPMRREEISRKIAAGAVGPDSLAWREGMDDWRPLRDVPELAVLCAPPPVRAGQVPEPPRASMMPLGGRAPVAAPPAQEWTPLPAETRASQPPSVYPPHADSSMTALPTGPLGMSWGAMFALMCGFAFLMTATALLGAHFLSGGKETATPPAAAVASPEPPPAAEEVAAPDLEINLDEIELEEQEIEASPTPNKKTASTTKKRAASGKQLTAAQKEMLARMGGDNEVASIKAPSSASSGSSTSGKGLSAGQLSTVVRRGRTALQRCYETALRQIGGSDETVRMDVEITVSPSGNVSKANATGKGLAGMEQCLERTVKAWRFPSSGSTTVTSFPVVFQPGG